MNRENSLDDSNAEDLPRSKRAKHDEWGGSALPKAAQDLMVEVEHFATILANTLDF
jgi:hypothetical protein